MKRALVLLVVALTTLVPTFASGTGTPWTLWLDTEGGCATQGILVDSAPPTRNGCGTIPSSSAFAGRRVDKDFIQVTAFGASTTLGDDALLHLRLGHLATVIGTPHPLLVARVTLSLNDSATSTVIGQGIVPCPYVHLTNGNDLYWSCDLTMSLSQTTAPAGSWLVLLVEWTRDEMPISPVFVYGANGSRIMFSG